MQKYPGYNNICCLPPQAGVQAQHEKILHITALHFMCNASQQFVRPDSSSGHCSHLGLQHKLGDVEVPLYSRNVEGGGAHWPHAVCLAPLNLSGGAGAKLQQGLHGLQVAASRCKMQRRETRL